MSIYSKAFDIIDQGKKLGNIVLTTSSCVESMFDLTNKFPTTLSTVRSLFYETVGVLIKTVENRIKEQRERRAEE